MELKTFVCFSSISILWFITQTFGKTVKVSEMRPPAPTPLVQPKEAEDVIKTHIVAAKLSYYFSSRKRRDVGSVVDSSGYESGSGVECGSGEDSTGICATEGSGETETLPDIASTSPKITEPPESTVSPPAATTEKLAQPTAAIRLPDVDLIEPDSLRPSDRVPTVLFMVPVYSSQSSELQNICLDWPAAGNQGWYRVFKLPALDMRARIHKSHRGGQDLIMYGIEVFSGPRIHVYATKYGIRINRKVYRWGAVHRGSRILLTDTWLRIRLENEATLVIHRTEINGKPTLVLEMKNNEKYRISTLGLLGGISQWRAGLYGPDNIPVLVDEARRLAHPLMSVKVNDFQCEVPQSSLETILRTPVTDFQLSNGHLYRF